MEIEARIIAMIGETLSEEQQKRYAPRISQLKDSLIPKITQYGIGASLFRAITPTDNNITIEDSFVEYDGVRYVRGKNREGRLASPYEVSLAMGHIAIWKESVNKKIPILVLEDDACISDDSMEYTKKSIDLFTSTLAKKNPRSILYLQSVCPWRPNQPKKNYDNWELMTVMNGIRRIAPTAHDTSGTTAYLVTPSSSEYLIAYAEKNPIWALDGMLDDARHTGDIHLYVPSDYTRNFELCF